MTPTIRALEAQPQPSTVTDEMLERALKVYSNAASGNFTPYSWMMRAALEAALSTHLR